MGPRPRVGKGEDTPEKRKDSCKDRTQKRSVQNKTGHRRNGNWGARWSCYTTHNRNPDVIPFFFFFSSSLNSFILLHYIPFICRAMSQITSSHEAVSGEETAKILREEPWRKRVKYLSLPPYKAKGRRKTPLRAYQWTPHKCLS